MQGYDSPTITSKLYQGILAVKRVFDVLKFKYAPDRRGYVAGLPFPLICIFVYLVLTRARLRGRLAGMRDLTHRRTSFNYMCARDLVASTKCLPNSFS